MAELGPVSAHLEHELRELARQRGIVFFLDKEGVYTGFASPFEQAVLGQVSGSTEDMALAGAVFGGPRPWMAEIF